MVTGGNSRPNRQRYASADDVSTDRLPPLLPNHCGVGLFLVTRGGESGRVLIFSRQKAAQTMSANLFSYSASGPMGWPLPEESLGPYADVVRECEQELGLDPADLVVGDLARLITVGLDTTELYMQFSFVVEADLAAAEVLRRARKATDRFEQKVHAVDFTPATVADILCVGEWEPPVGAALMTFAIKSFGLQEFEAALAQRYSRPIDDCPGRGGHPSHQARPAN